MVTRIGNHSICLGGVGNLLVLSRVEGWDTQGDAWRAIPVSGENSRWLCGVPGGVFTPGLMTGLAGVGGSGIRCGTRIQEGADQEAYS